jgi:hypothetical protein
MRMRSSFVVGILLLVGIVPITRADSPVVEVAKSHIDFRLGKELLTRYQIDEKVPRPYFYPLNALPGVRATRAWPMEDDPEAKKKDHVHHRSLWFCHGDVVPEGMEYKKHFKNVEGVDFWSENKGHGKIVCTSVEKPTVNKNHALIVTKNEWRTAEGQKIMDETRTIHHYTYGPGANLLVFDIDLHASVAPIKFADTKEGSMALRIREVIRADRGGTLTNAEGKTGEGKAANMLKTGCWGLVSAWCDYSGKIDEKTTVGIAIFADPKNPIDTAWHARDYGLLGANPFGRDKHARFPDRKGNDAPVKIAKGEHLKLRYGVYVHEGDVKTGKVAEYYDRFGKLAAK